MYKTAWLVALLVPSVLWAQPTLSSLWPNEDGRIWHFDFTAEYPFGGDTNFTASAYLLLEGTAETEGGTAQVLVGSHPDSPASARAHGLRVSLAAAPRGLDPILRAVWRARPDLRRAIEAKASPPTDEQWWPLFLHPGLFMKNPTSIQMWQPLWAHPTWTYLQDPITVGASFTHQLVPELADDVFLHGTIESTDASVENPYGTYEHAVRVRYLIDYGTNVETNEAGEPIGLVHSESRGHVHYVPGAGPVDMAEDFIPYVSFECDPVPCPPEWTENQGLPYARLLLSLKVPQSVVPSSWSAVKSHYR